MRSPARPPLEQRRDGEAHHHLGAAQHRDAAGAVEVGAADQPGDDADVPEPLRPGGVDGHEHLEPPLRPRRRAPRRTGAGRGCARRRAARAARSARGRPSRCRTAGRSGARPIPPATITTSAPSTSSTGQGVPNGPRTPSACPGPGGADRLVASPTARTVWTSRRAARIAADRDRHLAGSAGREHRELARREREPVRPGAARARASTCRRCPALGAHRDRDRAPSVPGSRLSRRGACPYTSSSCSRVACSRSTIDRGEPAHQLVAELVVGLALAAQASAVERRPAATARPRGRRTASGRARTATTTRRLRRREASRSRSGSGPARAPRARRAVADQEEAVGRLALAQQVRPAATCSLTPQPAINSRCAGASPANTGASAISSSIPRIRPPIALPDRARLLGDVDPHRAPGDAAAAAHAARAAELVDPGRELVRHPLAVARARASRAPRRRGCGSSRS